MPPNALTEGDITRTLREMGYTIRDERPDGLVYYEHPEIPVGYLVFDFSRGPIPWNLVEQDLEESGVNIDAFVVYLDC